MQAWAPEEDQIILDMVNSEGPKWSRIVQRLPGRSVSSVRNRWQRIEKGRKLREQGVESKNRCHACGEPKRGHVCLAKMRGGSLVEFAQEGTAAGMAAGMAAGIDPATMQIAAQLGPPSVVGQLNQLNTLSTISVAQPMLTNQYMQPMPPPPRRTRSHSDLELGEPEKVKLLKTNQESFYGNVSHGGSSGSLFPPAADAVVPMFTVDVAAAANPHGQGVQGQPPKMERSNTSFFKTLVESEAFSPSTRGLFESWADSPRDKPMPPALVKNLSSGTAPPALQRLASGESQQKPKMTRSVSSFLHGAAELLGSLGKSNDQIDPASLGLEADVALLTHEVPAVGDSAEAMDCPPLQKRRSSRLNVVFPPQ
eukprot:CAMPEP_0119311312 /NCGR_PEP_ID=MMETSP1333-20130426/22038_1 /TAXON_ID=418940 /ORGANISM="Scyphosphaera apsteinii, Strain RCC1455" /LENGTH=366 /DNA_ID=CAMNT_0007315661 /DNA_START=68 /DNA_END=1168 /DNA_ORIENTATION=+